MSPFTHGTPIKLGEALKGARAAAGVSLESIAEHTKISIHALRALECGDFAKLPSRVFARMFLRQYVEFIGEAPAKWLEAFDASWQSLQESSQPSAVGPPVPVRRQRTAPWVLGSAIVAAGIAGIVLLERSQRGTQARLETRPPESTAVAATAAPQPIPTTAPAPIVPAQGTLIVRTADSECWVEVRVANEKPLSRLLAPRAVWEVPAGGRDVDLVFGNAGSAGFEYMGEVRNPVGAEGAVARVHLTGQPAEGGPR